MIAKDFLNSVAKDSVNVIELMLKILSDTGSGYCVIGGLAVNAYAEPVVSLDLDIIVAVSDIYKITEESKEAGFEGKQFEHSINLNHPDSDFRIQLQTDPRYQDFINRSKMLEILGYRMMVASVEDVLKGKVWAYQDKERRKSKRQKDLADIMRLIEVYPALVDQLPDDIHARMMD